jgi:uncharacterized ParB-like nuclease family protein
MELPLTDITLDETLHVRAGTTSAVVAHYKEAMAGGAVFPPLDVFLLDGAYLLADGYHRFRAAESLKRSTLAVEVHEGSRTDALWFALGANRVNGQQMTMADKSHAVRLALAAWPLRTCKEIAVQVGCSSSLVSDVIAKNNGGQRAIRGAALKYQLKKDAVREMLRAGKQSIEIIKELRVHSTIIAAARKELGLSKIDYSRKAVKARHAEMQRMATAGYTSHQIASELGLSLDGCRATLKKLHIVVPADAVTRNLHHHDSTRIMARIVADAEDLTAGVNLIDFSALDRAQLADWVATLRQARTSIGMFIKRLTEEQSHEAA